MAKVRLFFFVILLMLCFSCQRSIEYPTEPSITFEGFAVNLDTSTHSIDYGILSIGYLDGDGDLGLDKADTLSPFNYGSAYYYNLIIKYFEIKNNDTLEVPLVLWNAQTLSYDTATFSARFPRLLEADAAPRSLQGVINYRLFINNPLSNNDTILFKISILDRALHQSNEVYTNLIIRNYNHYLP